MTDDGRNRDFGALLLLLSIVELALVAGALVSQIGLRDRLGVLTVRVEALEAARAVSSLHGAPTSQTTTSTVYDDSAERAIAEGRRDLAGAEREVKR